jgi:hypothetical protein
VADEVKIDWYADKVHLKIDEHTQRSLEAAAFRIEERTKVNISETPGASGQGLIDTGFMWNSTYVVTPHRSTYDQTEPTGLYVSPNQGGREVKRHIAPEEPLDEDVAALVAVGAEYAIYLEIQHGFFFKAIEDTRAEFKGLIEPF